MKVVIEFNLPEEKQDYDRCNKASDLCAFIWEFQNYLRTQSRYDGTDDIHKIYSKWFEMLNDEGIDLENIYS